MNQPWPGPGQAAVAKLGLEGSWKPAPAEARGAGRRRPRRAAFFAFAATLVACGVAYPVLPRRYEASASIVLQPTDNDGQADRSLRQPLDENALQSEVDLASAPGIIDAVIRAHGLDRDPEFAGAHGAREALREASHALRDLWRRAPEPPDWLRLSIWPKLPGWLPSPGWLALHDRPRTETQLRRAVAEHLLVSRERKSYTVRLGFWSRDPAKATAMSATLLDAYLDAQRSRKRAALSWLTGWLSERATMLTRRYEEARRKLDDYLAANGLLDTGAQVELDQRLQILAMEAARARGRLVEAQSRSRELSAMRDAGTLDQAQEILASPAVLKLKEGLAAAMSRTAVWSSETGAIERQIQIESERVVASAAAEAHSWEARERMLGEQVLETRRQIERRRTAERAASELQRTADVERVAMEEGLVKLKGMADRTKVVEPDAVLIGAPEDPAGPAFPKPILTALAALGLALMAGCAASWRETVAVVARIVRA